LLANQATDGVMKSRDGHAEVIGFDHQDRTGRISVWVLPMNGDRKPYAFLDTQFNVQMGNFSPDGRRVAYVSNDSGRDEVYVVPFPGPGARVQVSTGGGSQPRWRSDGRELVYLSPQTKMMAAEVAEGGSTFRVGAVRTLFLLSGRLEGVPGYLYDMTPDGQRFIAVQDLEHTSSIPLTVVVNWDAELRKTMMRAVHHINAIQRDLCPATHEFSLLS
jgi:eukaryotic-like serine/threonine-protein kinase